MIRSALITGVTGQDGSCLAEFLPEKGYDYVEAMWLMLRHDRADDFVVATGENHSVRGFAERACAVLGLSLAEHVAVDPRYRRPAEVEGLLGDASKAKRDLGWRPKVGFSDLVEMMVASDLTLAGKERQLGDGRECCR